MHSVDQVLADIPFDRPAAARRSFERIAAQSAPEDFDRLAKLLRDSPDPDAGLSGIDRFTTGAGETAYLFSAEHRLSAAIRLFSHSSYLTETLLRSPELLSWYLDDPQQQRLRSTRELRTELGWLSPLADEESSALILARFKRMQLLRIAARDVLDLAMLPEVALELSNLADTILQGALEYMVQKLTARFGRPLSPADHGPIESEFVVLALGKHGGRELNYSSDIDLMFLFTDEGGTSGPIVITNKEFFTQVANGLTDLVSRITPEGSCYRVDLRLRPEGRVGEVVVPLRSAIDYYHRRARDWELQMLIKARPAAGSAALGRLFLDAVQPLIYQTSTDFSMIERISETRDRIQEKLRSRSRGGTDVKLARGGIRDIEFMVQCLQRLHGGRDAWLRSSGTLFALHRLLEKGYLSMPDYAQLAAAYQYFRVLEHRLQLEENRQTHTLPSGARKREVLSNKMRDLISPHMGRESMEQQMQLHFDQVTEIYGRVIYSQEPAAIGSPWLLEPVEESEDLPPLAPPSLHEQIRHIERHAPALADAVRSLPILWGSRRMEHLLNRLVSMPSLCAEIENSKPLLACVADLFEHSPYLAEHLIAHPEDIKRLKAVAESLSEENSALFDRARADVGEELEAQSDLSGKSDCLRRFYRHEMLRILAGSIYGRRPIFHSLGDTSRLADWVIQTAYRLAVDEVFPNTHPAPGDPSMQVIAMGRLGMREFDLGSDADIVFFLDDAAAGDHDRWTQVAEQLIEIISSYTREGFIFAVDTRLRPMGRDGELVQIASRYKRYFAEVAEPWEAITYMKARTVAGNIPRGTQSLNELQDIGWHRWGMDTELARLLVEMRERIEREQGASHPIKSGPGGYYDIDFILMYLRLKAAGVFFESLNTPERIAVIHSTGGLDATEAEEFYANAVFFRALDHACRVMTGHSTSRIPTDRAHRGIVRELLSRWSQTPSDDRSLPELLHEVQVQTRRLFGKILQTGR